MNNAGQITYVKNTKNELPIISKQKQI